LIVLLIYLAIHLIDLQTGPENQTTHKKGAVNQYSS